MTPVRNPTASGFSLDGPSTDQQAKPVRKRSGFMVPIDPETGVIDMSRANPEQIAKLQTALGSKPVTEVKKDVPKPEINPALVEQFYALLEMGIQRAGTWLLKWPPQLACEMYFSDDKKAALIQPTKDLADEFAPLWLVENQKFIAFGSALTTAVNDMVTKATDRYMAKVLRGEAPLPPGVKIAMPVARTATQTPVRESGTPVAQEPPPKTAPTNGAATPAEKVTAAGAKGFIPAVPSGAGLI